MAFENRTYEAILEEVLAEGRELGVDTRQGSIFYDAVAGVIAKHAMFYVDLQHAIDLCFVDTAVGEYLDKKGAEYALYRNPATSARFHYVYEGTRPDVGERFFTDGLYFTLIEFQGEYLLEADQTGTAENSILPGTAAVPVNNLTGLTASVFGELYEPGVEVEADEDYRQRIREKLAGPAENGNRQHYKTWCEEVQGVGRARIIPLFAGENTVMGVIFGADGQPAADAVVDRVQEYIDPAELGLEVEYEGKMIVVGDGLGNGKANIGAHFAAVPADSMSVLVSFKATLYNTGTVESLVQEATEALTEHFRTLALTSTENEQVVIRISTVGSIIHSLPSLLDYDALTLNGAAANIELKSSQVAVLAGVTVDV